MLFSGTCICVPVLYHAVSTYIYFFILCVRAPLVCSSMVFCMLENSSGWRIFLMRDCLEHDGHRSAIIFPIQLRWIGLIFFLRRIGLILLIAISNDQVYTLDYTFMQFSSCANAKYATWSSKLNPSVVLFNILSWSWFPQDAFFSNLYHGRDEPHRHTPSGRQI